MLRRCLFALPLLAACASTAAAEPGICGRREEVVQRLTGAYGETRRGLGIQHGQAVVEVYASDDTGSWTIILSTPEGLACLLATGSDWSGGRPSGAPRGADPA